MTKWIRMAPGIRRNAHGIEARAQIGRRERRYARYPLNTPLADIQAWQRAERQRLRAAEPFERMGMGRPSKTAGTLEAAAERFLPQIAGRASFKADRSHLRAWFSAMGRHRRPLGEVAIPLITTEDVNLAIAYWQTAPAKRDVRRIRVVGHIRNEKRIDGHDRLTPTTSGQVVAANTIRHRCRLLEELYRTLDLASPVRRAKIPKVPKPHPIGVPIEIVRQVAQHLARASKDSTTQAQTYARFAVLVTTGQRPCQVMRTQPSDLNLDAGLWMVRSAKNEPAHTITLNADMMAAWRCFVAADAWGLYDTTKHARSVHAAGWPTGIRPYAARHSVMIDALAAGVPLDDVQGLAGHTSPVTTRQFYGPITVSRQRVISEKLQGRFGDVFGLRAVPVLPPHFTTPETGKGRKGGENIGLPRTGTREAHPEGKARKT